jgi:hypothetical protein
VPENVVATVRRNFRVASCGFLGVYSPMYDREPVLHTILAMEFSQMRAVLTMALKFVVASPGKSIITVRMAPGPRSYFYSLSVREQ